MRDTTRTVVYGINLDDASPITLATPVLMANSKQSYKVGSPMFFYQEATNQMYTSGTTSAPAATISWTGIGFNVIPKDTFVYGQVLFKDAFYFITRSTDLTKIAYHCLVNTHIANQFIVDSLAATDTIIVFSDDYFNVLVYLNNNIEWLTYTSTTGTNVRL